MENFLSCKDFCAIVGVDTGKSEVMFVDNWKKIKCKTICNNGQWMDNSVIHYVSN